MAFLPFSASLHTITALSLFATLSVVPMPGVAMMTAPVAVLPAPSPSMPSTSPFVLPLRRESVPVRRKGQIVSHKTSYSGVINVGHPAQEFRVVFDTGSGHVVLPSTECQSVSCLVHRRYNQSASETAVATNLDGTPVQPGDLSDQVTIGYGTGQVTGQFVKDEVCIGFPTDSEDVEKKGVPQPCEKLNVVMAVEMSKQPFKNFGFDGILGLGLSSLALAKSFSFFDVLSHGSKASSPHFSVFLTDGEDGDESEIAFGGHNPQKLLGPLSWAPVVNSDLGYWQLQLLAVRVDGKTLDVCQDGSCRGVMDTGTSHLGIPTPHNEVLGNLLLQPADGISDCRTVEGPVLEFEFPGFNMTLHPEDYMRTLPLAEGIQVGSTKGVTLDEQPEKPAVSSVVSQLLPGAVDESPPKYQCRPRLMPVNLPAPLGPKLFILGEPVLHRYYTVFDWKGPQIGLGLASKRRYADPAKMAEVGQVLREDVKAVLAAKANLGDEVVLVQVTVSLRLRRK